MGKRKISKISHDRAVRLWCIVVPLLVLLFIFLRYPLRIDTGELDHDIQFYGAITLITGLCAFALFRRYRRSVGRLMIALLICALLSGWQVFDLMILHNGGPMVDRFWPDEELRELPLDQGWNWFNVRFKRGDVQCHTMWERYYGSRNFAITIEMDRNATWLACGG